MSKNETPDNINGHDMNGKFMKGLWKGGPGRGVRKRDAIIHNFREAIRQAVTVGEVQKIFLYICKCVHNENLEPETRLKAAELVLDRVVGKPVPMSHVEDVEVLRLEMDEVKRLEDLVQDAHREQKPN